MPSAAEVLARLTMAANEYTAVAIAWHIVILSVSLALVTRRLLPSARAATLALTTPLVSVAVIAVASGNLFNGAVFGAAAIVLALLANRVRGRIRPPSSVAAAVGVGAIVLGLSYPHFLAAKTLFDYFYSAPTGLVPCPTLLVVIGFTLLGSGFGARGWSIVLASLGLVYGITGVLWLGVTLDVVLLVAALALLVEVLAPSLMEHRSARSAPRTRSAAAAQRPAARGR